MSCYQVFNSIDKKHLKSECMTKFSRTPTSSYPAIPDKVLGNQSANNDLLVVANEDRKTCIKKDTEFYKRHFYNFDNLCVKPQDTADVAFSRQGVPTRNLRCLNRNGCKCNQHGNKQIIKK